MVLLILVQVGQQSGIAPGNSNGGAGASAVVRVGGVRRLCRTRGEGATASQLRVRRGEAELGRRCLRCGLKVRRVCVYEFVDCRTLARRWGKCSVCMRVVGTALVACMSGSASIL